MCSEYLVKTTPKEIEAALGFPIQNKVEDFLWDNTIRLHTKAPVIRLSDEGPEMVLKTFPSSPMPNSRLSGIGNQSEGNDPEDEEREHIQIKRIYEMPRWKEGFKSQPVIIPMSSFREFAYWGDEKGTGQNFALKDQPVLFAAGLLFKPFAPKGGPFDGFSILTHTATEQMLNYHHRLIVLLKPEDAFSYLEPMKPEERFDYLIEKRYQGALEVSKVRDMAKGWDKKVGLQEGKLRREMQYRATLEKEGVSG